MFAVAPRIKIYGIGSEIGASIASLLCKPTRPDEELALAKTEKAGGKARKTAGALQSQLLRLPSVESGKFANEADIWT